MDDNYPQYTQKSVHEGRRTLKENYQGCTCRHPFLKEAHCLSCLNILTQ
jgi:hypothetical protein